MRSQRKANSSRTSRENDTLIETLICEENKILKRLSKTVLSMSRAERDSSRICSVVQNIVIMKAKSAM